MYDLVKIWCRKHSRWCNKSRSYENLNTYHYYFIGPLGEASPSKDVYNVYFTDIGIKRVLLNHILMDYGLKSNRIYLWIKINVKYSFLFFLNCHQQIHLAVVRISKLFPRELLRMPP